MSYTSDRDGKSKTASAVDHAHYPEQDEVDNIMGSPAPNHDRIAVRAFELWQARGCPEGSAERDWLDAEAELCTPAGGGSVQG
jgi:Protein of unknown function (DUF2934)